MLFYGILFLFFFTLVSDFVAAIYAFGLLGTSIPPEIVSVLFLFTPAILLFRRRGLSQKGMALTAGLALAAGAVEIALGTRGRMLVSGLGVGAFMVWLPALLQRQGEAKGETQAARLGAGLALGLASTVVFRAWNSGVDPAPQWWFRAAVWAMAVAGGTMLLREFRRGNGEAPAIDPGPPAGFSRVVGASLGMVSALALLYFAFASPNVIAGWTGASYQLILSIMMAALALFAFGTAALSGWPAASTGGKVALWSGVFVVSLLATILPHQLGFPAEPGGYPLYEPPTHPLSQLPLVLTLALFPVILLGFGLYARELIVLRPSVRALSGAFLLASLALLILIFAQVFTTVYDYIPVVGPFFRDKFWAVFLALGLGLTLPLLQLRSTALAQKAGVPKPFARTVLLLGAAAIAGALLTASRPATPTQDRSSVRVLTYNIQQGYDEDGLQSLDGQLAVIREAGADIVGLQETDSNRIAGGNSDLVRYLADRLDLYVYDGPRVVPGTFGIALLSRYPIENPRTFYMYSEGEQTATISARVTVSGKTFNVFVTHLGNGGPIVQQQALMQAAAGLDDVIAMGDFNFRPGGDPYALTTATLADAWLLRWQDGSDDSGFDPSDRIDHVFLSPGTTVLDARYLTGPESDHPALVVEIGVGG